MTFDEACKKAGVTEIDSLHCCYYCQHYIMDKAGKIYCKEHNIVFGNTDDRKGMALAFQRAVSKCCPKWKSPYYG